MIELGLRPDPPAEHRTQGYTDAIIAGLVAVAGGDVPANDDLLAVVEGCRNRWRRALAACTVEPARARQVFTPAVRMQIVEGLLSRDGASVHKLDVDPLTGRLALLAASSWEVWGSGAHPATWRYDLSEPAPTDGTRQVWAGREQVLHVQWTSHPRYPWRSVGPWAASASTSRLAARIEQTLAREHNSPVGNVVPTPENDQATKTDDDGDPVAGGLLDALMQLRGGLAMVPTFNAGLGLGQHAAPQRDWRTTRIGPAPSKETIDLRQQVVEDLSEAAGVPAVLTRPESDGTAKREAYRVFVASSLRPLLDQIEVLASELLEVEVRISAERLAGADVASRARAYRALAGKDGNLPVDAAREIVGL
ncbi:MAG: hypothetical protein F4018_12920 [Acidobacteria bacterium]|nr:hypothetical protein [Acidobacteriota bacterium]